MNKKIKTSLITIFLSLFINVSSAQNIDKPLGGIGLGFIAKLNNPTFIVNNLETDPEATTNYFEKNPLNYNSVAKVLIPRLKNAQIARAILAKYGIDINDAVNGVYLPTTDSSTQSGIKHNGKHPTVYVDKVTADIVNADMLGGEAAVRLRLAQLRNIK